MAHILFMRKRRGDADVPEIHTDDDDEDEDYDDDEDSACREDLERYGRKESAVPACGTQIIVTFEESVVEEHKTNVNVSPPSTPRRSSALSTSSTISSTVQQRKFSFPTALPSNFLKIESSGASARRRLSNVSDAVSRKLSTIGWKTSHNQSREIVTVGKSLCSQYIRSRLKRSGFLSKKCGLQRVRSAVSLGGDVFREVYPELVGLGIELERLHPKVYVNVTRQASSFPGGRLSSEKEVGAILAAVSRELLKNEITWGKVVSLYAVAGGLAVDCVRQGHHEYLTYIVETMEDILEEELAQWIQYKGGWYALAAMVRPPQSKWPSPKASIYFFSFFAVTLLIAILISHLGMSASS